MLLLLWLACTDSPAPAPVAEADSGEAHGGEGEGEGEGEGIELSRVELVERLAALVPPPRANTVRTRCGAARRGRGPDWSPRAGSPRKSSDNHEDPP